MSDAARHRHLRPPVADRRSHDFWPTTANPIGEILLRGPVAPTPYPSENGVGIPPNTESENQLIAHVTNELSWHKRPRELHFVDDFPRTPLGKVQKKLLLDGLTSADARTASARLRVNSDLAK